MVKDKQTRPRGRPSSFQAAFVDQARKLCQLGATDLELADFFEVSIRTIDNWKVAHPEFLQALKAAKDAADDRVERSLYHRAVGYSFDTEKVFQYQGQIVRTPVQEHVPPDTTAAIFWLKNRRRAEWRDRHEHEHGQVGEFDNLTAEELRQQIADRLKAAQLPAGKAPSRPRNAHRNLN